MFKVSGLNQRNITQARPRQRFGSWPRKGQVRLGEIRVPDLALSPPHPLQQCPQKLSGQGQSLFLGLLTGQGKARGSKQKPVGEAGDSCEPCPTYPTPSCAIRWRRRAQPSRLPQACLLTCLAVWGSLQNKTAFRLTSILWALGPPQDSVRASARSRETLDTERLEAEAR